MRKILALIVAPIGLACFAAPASAAVADPTISVSGAEGAVTVSAKKVSSDSVLSLEFLMPDGTWAVYRNLWIECPGVTPPWEQGNPGADKRKYPNAGHCSVAETVPAFAGQWRGVVVEGENVWYTPSTVVS